MSVDDLPFDLSDRTAVALEEVVATAARLVRVDRKYLVDRPTAQALVDQLPSSHRLLAIDGRRATTYRSTYFDTAQLAACRAHVQQRRRRWKVRSRLYDEDSLCRLEVKTRDGRDVTTKSVTEVDPAAYGRLDGTGLAFAAAVLSGHGHDVDVTRLRPTAEVGYRRATLADTTDEMSRVTLDWRVVGTLGGHGLWLDDRYLLVETKGGMRPGRADRLLGRLGVRPRSFSKYVATASLLHAGIPDNDVRALHGTVLHSGPVTGQVERAIA